MKIFNPIDKWISEALFRDDDFLNPKEADKFYKSHSILPRIQLKLKESNIREINQITIIFLDSRINGMSKVKYEPFELLLPSFWKKIGIAPDFDSIPYLEYINRLFERNRPEEPLTDNLNIFPIVFWNLPIIDQIPYIWNESCIFEGRATITKIDFCVWIYRLHSVLHDLVEYPFSSDANWKKRKELLKYILKNKYSKDYEYYLKDHWSKTINNKFTSEDAYKSRLFDTKSLLNTFFSNIKSESALEKFLITIYNSFSSKLVSNKILFKCKHCGDYIDFVKGKKYCSMKAEGKDCGKKARNKKYYRQHRKEILPKARNYTRKYRKLLKIKGIKK